MVPRSRCFLGGVVRASKDTPSDVVRLWRLLEKYAPNMDALLELIDAVEAVRKSEAERARKSVAS